MSSIVRDLGRADLYLCQQLARKPDSLRRQPRLAGPRPLSAITGPVSHAAAGRNHFHDMPAAGDASRLLAPLLVSNLSVGKSVAVPHEGGRCDHRSDYDPRKDQGKDRLPSSSIQELIPPSSSTGPLHANLLKIRGRVSAVNQLFSCIVGRPLRY